MSEKSFGKAERLIQIENLLLAHSRGLTKSELARRLGVHRSTIGRDIAELSTSGRLIIYEEDGRLKLDRDAYLTHVRFTMHEALAIHLAARLMATRMDKRNPHAASALRKLGQSLEKLAPPISRHILAAAEVMDEPETLRDDPVYLKVLEALTRAWSEGRMVRLLHEMEDGRTFEYDFAPYFIEPYAIGRTTHVIGWRDPPKKVRTFKIERIRWVELLSTRYEIPKSFDPRKLLRSAWGIWYTEGEPIRVCLRFSPRVARRVRETRWHPSERTEEQPDGSLLWEAEVAETQEMLPWIRGWGADVEVLEPPKLRNDLEKEVQRMAKLYGITTGGNDEEQAPAWLALWGKSKKGGDSYHPLIAHMIDVGMVARAMWAQSFTPALRQRAAAWLGLSEEEAQRLLAFWIALHDLGKATPAFQAKVDARRKALEALGFPFSRVAISARHSFAHGTATAQLLPPLLTERLSLTSRRLTDVARVLGGHHGQWPKKVQDDSPQANGSGEVMWQEARKAIVQALYDLFQPPSTCQLPRSVRERNAFWTFLSGYTTAADWVGSMENHFPFIGDLSDVAHYVKESERRAEQALEATDWTRWQPPHGTLDFTKLFAVPSARPMQNEVIRLAEQLNGPALVILEAPTGSGKTEAALYLADRLIAKQGMRGFYVAMPTMATSNQMYGRVGEMLQRRYGDRAQPLLLHSQARWMKDDRLPKLNLSEGEETAMRWFLRRRRGLLAPFAVGTVDQALLSVLQTRYFFIRHFGLSGKVLIFDEVHAYDTYMTTLFEQLLRWLRELGATVVILSATLPQATRNRLLATYAAPGTKLPALRAPALSWVKVNGTPHVKPLPVLESQQREVALEIIAPETLPECLAHELREGGCAAVLCNTVKQAQQTYAKLRQTYAQLREEEKKKEKKKIVPADEDLILFHARFPLWRRQEIEREVLRRFGKGQEGRPEKAIVVATQVIEQSLDLDFDLMVSEVAPIDLLIQRVGRLHRHERPRPAPLAEPRLLLLNPGKGEHSSQRTIGQSPCHALDPGEIGDVPDFGNSRFIYEPYLLLRTWELLQKQQRWRLPNEAADLIEDVYAAPDEALAEESALAARWQQAQQKWQREEKQAAQVLIPPVNYRDLLRLSTADLKEEEDPTIHQSLRAMTRLSMPTLQVACLHRLPDGTLNTRPDGSGSTVNLKKRPGDAGTASPFELAQTVVSVSGRLYEALRELETPPAWQRHAYFRYIRPLVFEEGTALEGKLTLDEVMGLHFSG